MIAVNIELRDFLQKYLPNFTWEGTLTINGGWGPKDVVLNACIQLQEQGFPLVITPRSIPVNKEQDIRHLDDLDEILGINLTKPAQYLEEYLFSFPGEHYPGMFKFLLHEGLRDHKLKLTLNSYSEFTPPKPKQDIFQLTATAHKGDIVFILTQGNWVPSFEDSIPIQSIKWSWKK